MNKPSFMAVCEEVARGAKVLHDAVDDEQAGQVSFDRPPRSLGTDCLHIAYEIWRWTNRPPEMQVEGYTDARSAQFVPAPHQMFAGADIRRVNLEAVPTEVLEAFVVKLGDMVAKRKAGGDDQPKEPVEQPPANES